MKPPAWWEGRGPLARLLSPVGALYQAGSALRRARGRGESLPVPALIVGNLTAGGSGKTPTVAAIAQHVAELGASPLIISRGYGARVTRPRWVQPEDRAADIGDEPLMLARMGLAVIVCDDRTLAVIEALQSKASRPFLIFDDGFQSGRFRPDQRWLVIDGASGFGNGLGIPAGPLRERIHTGLAAADLIVLIGTPTPHLAAQLEAHRVTRATVGPAGPWPKDRPVLAFAGIAQPEKLWRSLATEGIEVAARHGFPDHHPFTEAELQALAATAAAHGARLVTTAKDHARLSPAWAARVTSLPVRLRFEDEPAIRARLLALLEAER